MGMIAFIGTRQLAPVAIPPVRQGGQGEHLAGNTSPKLKGVSTRRGRGRVFPSIVILHYYFKFCLE